MNQLLTLVAFAEDRIHHIPGIPASQQKYIRGFLRGQVSGKTYCRCISYGIEEICFGPTEQMYHIEGGLKDGVFGSCGAKNLVDADMA